MHFGWGSAPDRRGSLQRSPDHLAAIQGATSKGRGGDRKIGKGKDGNGRGKGEEKVGRMRPPNKILPTPLISAICQRFLLHKIALHRLQNHL